MSAWTTFRDMDKKFSWSFLGFLLAAIFGGLTIYIEFIRDNRPSLRFDVTTSTDVLDIRESLPQLVVTYDGINIREQGLALHIIEVKVINDSSTDILKTFYDSNDPVGIGISTGKIIRAEVTDGSSDYLKKHAHCTVSSETMATFGEVMLDAEQSFVVKLLVLHPSNAIPVITPFGHVAGVTSIRLAESYKLPLQPRYLVRVFQGAWEVQLLRLAAYFIASIIILILVIAPTVTIGGALDKRKRRKAVDDFRRIGMEVRKQEEYLLQCFLEDGGYRLRHLRSILKDASLSTTICGKHRDKTASRSLDIEPSVMWIDGASRPVRTSTVDALLSCGLILEKDGVYTPDQEGLAFLESFISFLKERNLFSDREMVMMDAELLGRTPDSFEQIKQDMDANKQIHPIAGKPGSG